MNKINLSSKTCIQSWENNSSELEKCVKTAKQNACGDKCTPPYLRDLPLPIPIWGVRGWAAAAPRLWIFSYPAVMSLPESFSCSMPTLKLLWKQQEAANQLPLHNRGGCILRGGSNDSLVTMMLPNVPWHLFPPDKGWRSVGRDCHFNVKVAIGWHFLNDLSTFFSKTNMSYYFPGDI